MEAKDYSLLIAMHIVNPQDKTFYPIDRLTHLENMIVSDTTQAFKKVALFQVASFIGIISNTDNKYLLHRSKDGLLSSEDYAQYHEVISGYAHRLEGMTGPALLAGKIDNAEVHSLVGIIAKISPRDRPKRLFINLGNGDTLLQYSIPEEARYSDEMIKDAQHLKYRRPVIGYLQIRQPRKRPVISEYFRKFRNGHNWFNPSDAVVGEHGADAWVTCLQLELEIQRQQSFGAPRFVNISRG